jgi:hypothetical protein
MTIGGKYKLLKQKLEIINRAIKGHLGLPKVRVSVVAFLIWQNGKTPG